MTGIFEANVLVVEDDPFARTALEGLLKNCGFINVITCDGVVSAMATVDSFSPQLAVVDLDLGEGPNGIDLVDGLRRRIPELGVVMLSTYESPRLLGVASVQIPMGVIYLVKSEVVSPDVLLMALQRCWESVHGKTEELMDLSNKKLPSKLSDQHVEIMRLVAHGYSNSEIALRLVVSERTVEKSISRLIKNLNLLTDKSQNQRVKITQAYFGMAGLVRKFDAST
jgi:DNA-binding NarL/FixJ family response regulator